MRASGWIHSFAGGAAKTDEAGSDRQREGRAGREQPDRISQTEEKLVELVLIEKSTDPLPPAVRVQLWCRMLKDWQRIGVLDGGEFRCQRECETNVNVCVCACVCLLPEHQCCIVEA